MPDPAASARSRSSWPSTSAPTSPRPPAPPTSTGYVTSARTWSSTTARRTSSRCVRDIDVVLDSLGGENLEKSLRVLRPGGLAIGIGGPPDPDFAGQLGRPLLRPVLAVLSRKVRPGARKNGVRYSFLFMRANGDQLTGDHLAGRRRHDPPRPRPGLRLRRHRRRARLRQLRPGQGQGRRHDEVAQPVPRLSTSEVEASVALYGKEHKVTSRSRPGVSPPPVGSRVWIRRAPPSRRSRRRRAA